MSTSSTGRRRAGLAVAALLLAAPLAACGGSGSDVEGTYTDEEEGTIELKADGEGTIEQSGDVAEFTYEVDGDTLKMSIDGEVRAEATVEGGTLTFRAGDFSGDDPVTFDKE